MSSPLMEHRRYHKHRTKIKPKKRNAKSSHFKESHSKVNQLPRITEKRLTNKNGFNLKGAISTSPCSRGTKAHNVKKGTVDYDLKRLLQDAKNKVSKDISNSASTCSTFSSNGEDSIDLVDPLIEKGRKEKSKRSCGSFPAFPPKYKHHTKEVTASSSPENDISILVNNDDDSSNFKDQDLLFQGNSSGSTATRRVDLHNSSGNSVPTIRKRPSFSVRQKFAAGIVDSLVLEGKKQFPIENDCVSHWQRDVASNLTELFRKRHGIFLQSTYSLESDEVHKKDASLQKELLGKESDKPLDQDTRLYHNRDKMGAENKIVINSNLEQKMIDQNPKLCSKSEKDFKQKSTEAWVKAIAPDFQNNDKFYSKKKCQKDKISVPPCETTNQTEMEFLKNFKKSAVVKSTENPFKILSQPAPLWNEREKNIFWPTSPVLSPVIDHVPPAPIPHYSEVGCQLNSNHGHFSKKSKIDLYNKDGFFSRENGVNWYQDSPNAAIEPPKPHTSWFSWLKGSKEKGDPLSSADHFEFNPPVSKRSKNHIEKVYDQSKNKAISLANTSEMWGQFPKIARRSYEVTGLNLTECLKSLN